jgi:hypothetical protein
MRRATISSVIVFVVGLAGCIAAEAAAPAAYLSAGSKKARCAALSSWYVKTMEVAGANAFSPHEHTDQLQKTTARGFVDDVFVPAIGAPYGDLTRGQRKQIQGDIRSCDMAPVDNVMRDYMQSAFSDETNFSLVRGWRTAIATAQRRAADAASFQNGRAPAVAAPSSVARGFVTYTAASAKPQRCTALQEWYKRAIALTGADTFGSTGVYSHHVINNLARAFQDDTFPTYFGTSYWEIPNSALPQMKDDVLTCNTPEVGQWARLVSSAFQPGQSARDAWKKPIETRRAELAQMRYASIQERAPIAAVAPPPSKRPGPFDTSNRDYERIIFSDHRVNVGNRSRVSRKCADSIGYSVGIDLPPSGEITPALAQDVIENVLAPIAARECPAADLSIYAHFFHRTLSVTHRGDIVPAGSEDITSESELAVAMYGPGHRQQKAPPTMYYGGVNRNYPELASVEGMADYGKRGGRNPARAAALGPKVETRYVHYRPSQARGALAALRRGKLLQQIAEHDFLGIHVDPANYPDLESSSSAASSALGFLAMFAQGLKKLDPLGNDAIPPRRGFPYAVEAFSESCRASLGPNPATYTPIWREKVGEEVSQGLYGKIITEHWETKVGTTIYMTPAYRPIYADAIRTEKAIIVRDIFKARDELGLEQLFAGEAQLRPLRIVKEYQDAAKEFMRANGCEAGQRLLRNWVEFNSDATPPARPNGDYPRIIEHKRDRENGPDQIGVMFGEVPASEAPFHPYTDGTWLTVQYYGNRKGGLDSYYASHFTLAFVPGRVQQALLQDNELLDSFRNDRIRILNCFYDEGTVNYWLAGFPQPNERQKQVVGNSFRGSASRCPLRWPGPAPG